MLNIEQLNKIKTPTPFLAIDLSKVRQNYEELKGFLPNFDIYYAMKSNPEKEILEALYALGCKFEIASIGELKRLIKIGVKPEQVIFSNPVKIATHIRQAYQKGVRNFAFDSAGEIQKIAENAPGSKVYARVSVSNHGSIIDLSHKFGVQQDHVVALMGLANDHGLIPDGLAFHVGSQAENIFVWEEAIKAMAELIERLKVAGIEIKSLNVGGGIPIKYIASVPGKSEISQLILQSIKKYIPKGIKFVCEPGRALTGDAGVICTEVIGAAHRNNRPWLYLDTGRFQSFIEMFESDELKYPVYTACKKASLREKQLYTLTGPTCDSYDTIMQDVELPYGIQEGDRVYFGSAGAYTHVYGSAFNDFPVPAVVFKDNIIDK